MDTNIIFLEAFILYWFDKNLIMLNEYSLLCGNLHNLHPGDGRIFLLNTSYNIMKWDS